MTAETLVESRRLYLRRPAESDLPLFERIFCTADTMRFLDQPWTVDEAAVTLLGLTTDTVDGEPGLELSWFVVPAHQRRGYATEIGRELLGSALEESGAGRVVAETHPGNAAADGVLTALGFRRLGERRQESDHLPGCDRWVLWEWLG